MLIKYIGILLGVAIVVSSQRKDDDDSQPLGNCPCFKSVRGKRAYEESEATNADIKLSPCSAYDRIEDCPKKERKVYEKLQEWKNDQRLPFDDVDEYDSILPNTRRSPGRGRTYLADEEEPRLKKNRWQRATKKDKKQKLNQDRAADGDPDLDQGVFPLFVLPQCVRFVNDLKILARCQRKMLEQMGGKGDSSPFKKQPSESEPAFFPECKQFASDPYNLLKCIFKTANDDANLVQPPSEGVLEDYPECQKWAQDPQKLSLCVSKRQKNAGDARRKPDYDLY